MIIEIKSKDKKIKFHDTLGRLPEGLSSRRYMHMYHLHNDYEAVYDETMGWGFPKFKLPRVKFSFKSFNKFISGAAKLVGQIAKPVLKTVKGVGDFTEDVINAAKTAVVSTLPYDLRKYASVVLVNPITLIKYPAATVTKVTQTAGEIAHNIVKTTSDAVEVTYKQVARPAFRIARNVANETVWRPVHVVVDVAVMPILPKSVREKVDQIMDVPDRAFRGKLRDKDVLEACKAYAQLAMIPYKVAGKFNNDVINTLKKDNILGPFLEKVDLYTGGLLTSGQNLMAMPDDIYHDRQIDWKARLIDALKIYLASVTAASIKAYATGVGFNAAGQETGLNQTAIGRTVLAAGSMYYASYGTKDFANKALTEQATEVAKKAAIETAKKETVNHAVAKGYIDNKYLATMILSAGIKVGSAISSSYNDPYLGADGLNMRLDSAMSSVYDKEFQNAFVSEAQRLTGVPVEFRHLVDIYNTDWKSIGANVANGINTGSFSDGNFLSNLGKNIMNEINRLPDNASKIAGNVYDELARSPENMAKFARAVAAEANRTPENVVKIAENVARESALATQRAAEEAARVAERVAEEAARTPSNVVEIAQNVVTETAKGAENVAKEIVRTPENVAEIAQNVARETVRAGENIIDEAARTPENVKEIAENVARETGRAIDNVGREISNVNWDELIRKYGPQIIPYLQGRYPGFSTRIAPTQDIINELDMRFGQKKSNKGLLIAGLVGVAALAYVASDD